MNKSQIVFFVLLRAGLWNKDVQLGDYDFIDFDVIYHLAEEQSIVGLIAAGIEHVTDIKFAKKDVVQFIGKAFQLEQKNTAMNEFISVIVDQMRKAGIYPLLVKGQGVAQCYVRPLWRSCGDIDLLLYSKDYEKGKAFLAPLASSMHEENAEVKHLGMTIGSWVIEIHGTLRSGLGRRIDRVIDSVLEGTFKEGRVRAWRNGDTEIYIPAPDDDVLFVFTHILQHFFKGGIGLRQICDLCRLLWTYREVLDSMLLKERLRRMGLMSEWMAFAALSVDTLGIPKEAMPLYSANHVWRRKAKKILSFVLETGNFGQNRDNSYYEKYPFVIYKAISFWKNTKDSISHFFIFPKDALKVWLLRFREGMIVAAKGLEHFLN